MGLDQYIYVGGKDGKEFMFGDPRSISTEDIFILAPAGISTQPKGKPSNTWRKWFALHDYMGKKRVKLTKTLINELESWFRAQDPAYDTDTVDESDDATDIDFYRQWNKQVICIIRAATDKGLTVHYDFWD